MLTIPLGSAAVRSPIRRVSKRSVATCPGRQVSVTAHAVVAADVPVGEGRRPPEGVSRWSDAVLAAVVVAAAPVLLWFGRPGSFWTSGLPEPERVLALPATSTVTTGTGSR